MPMGIMMFLSISCFLILNSIISTYGWSFMEGECSALSALKQSLNFDTEVSSKLVSWNSSIECCSWNGVTCENGQVIGLDLSSEGINGGLDNSSSLFDLQHLKTLNLGYNRFHAPIPAAIGLLVNMENLTLCNSAFLEKIPVGIAGMTKLRSLDLSDPFSNALQFGLLNLTSFVRNLSNLEELRVDGMNISCQGSEWSSAFAFSLPNLRVLSMLNCNLFGPPDASLLRLQKLSSITLGGNSFSSTFPEFLLRFPNLTLLDLDNCQIEGTIPQNIFSIPSLEYLDVSTNYMLQVHLPEFSSNASLHTLNLYLTNSSGNLPSSIGNLLQLSKLDLHDCNFYGDLPYSIQNLSRLEYLDLSRNMFSGPLPDFSRLRNLTSLILSSNSLTGALPSSLFALPFLNNLVLPFNHFSGMLPEFSDALSSQINWLDLKSNNLEGPLPLSLFDLQNISQLDLSFNNFSGTVDLSHLPNFENLITLDLSYNSLSITIGSSNNMTLFGNYIVQLSLASCNVAAFPNLVNHERIYHLDLSNNHIQGEIPKWIWNIHHVNLSNNLLEGFESPVPRNHSATNQEIDLHHNLLSGPLLPILPKDAWVIDYSDNRLTSTIPINIDDYISPAFFFSLSNNQIVGTLPLSICNATDLVVLDLSNNRLEGTIPQCIFNMSSEIGIVNLGGNKLNGTIPTTFSQGCTLSTLDLNRNMVEGEIPRTLANCARLEVLNLGNNKIHDEFPCWLKGLPNLRVLVLRSNELTGPVQCSDNMNSNLWRSLQIIDLASNKLYGALPSEFFSELNAMSEASTEENSAPKQLGYDFAFGYYFDKVTVAIKGQQFELVKILTVYTSIDFSSNMFNGEIPKRIRHMTAVHVLNLSHNVLVGQIPSTLGNMKALESLDLSYNYLSDSIPEQLGQLNFLEWLNLSYNQLDDMIPTGSQLQTFQESAFLGNKGLCGSPLSVKCKDAIGSSSTPASSKVVSIRFHAGFLIKWDFMIGSEVGFMCGLVIIIGPLVIYPRWSRYYYRHLDNILTSAFGIRLNRRQRRHVSIIL